ncbi:MAG: carboxypeptidase-like regulatory domain-containing protein [Oryzihumus sp.]
MPSRAARTLLCAALLAGSALGVTAPALAATATLSGRVVDAVTGAPVTDACVQATDENWDGTASGCVDSDGRYSLDVPNADLAYRVQAYGGDYVAQYATGHYTWDHADLLTAPGTADFALERAGAMTGTLVDSDGHPVEGATVEAFRPGSDEPVYQGTSSVDGDLTATVPVGDLVVHVTDGTRSVWAPDATDREHATTYHATLDAGADLGRVALPPASGIAGTLTDDQGQPVSDLCATVPTSDQWIWACSDADGHYSAELSPGSYTVDFQSQNPAYPSIWSGGSWTETGAKPVTVAAAAVTAYDLVVPRGATMTGRVVDAAGNPVANRCPQPYLGRTQTYLPTSGGCTGADGTYTLTGVPPTRVTLVVGGAWGNDTWAYHAATQQRARVFRLSPGGTTALKDLRLIAGRVAAGRVTDAAGNPLEGVIVGTEYSPRAGGPEGNHDITDADGRYELTDLSGTSTTLVAWDLQGRWAPVWSGGAPTADGATAVHLPKRGAAQADFTMKPAGTLTGTVVDASGAPVADTFDVSVFSGKSTAVQYGAGGWYDGKGGTFSIAGMPQAPLVLRFDNWETGETFWYGGTDQASATPVTVEPGGTVHLTVTRPAH